MKKVTSGANTTYAYYQYDSKGNIVLETDEAQAVKVKYIRDCNGKAYAMQQNGNLYYYLYNAHGDVTELTDNTGTVVATYTYDEFGNLKSSTGSIYNPLRYSGANNAYYDSEIGLYKMGVRYYNPEVGRWITRDDYQGEQEQPQSKNAYAYCENNPIVKVDKTGMWTDYVHWNKTTLWARGVHIYNENQIHTIAAACRNLDDPPKNPWQHNDPGPKPINQYKWPSPYIWHQRFRLKARTSPTLNQRLKYLGKALHSLQDHHCHQVIRWVPFYGYSWVSLHSWPPWVIIGRNPDTYYADNRLHRTWEASIRLLKWGKANVLKR